MQFGDPLYRPDAISFQQELKRQQTFLVAGIHIPERPLVGLSEGLAALHTTVALPSITMLPELCGLDPAIVARHYTISLDRSNQKPDNEIARSVRLRLCGFQPRSRLASRSGLLLSYSHSYYT
jgi:hypothetical protein